MGPGFPLAYLHGLSFNGGSKSRYLWEHYTRKQLCNKGKVKEKVILIAGILLWGENEIIG